MQGDFESEDIEDGNIVDTFGGDVEVDKAKPLPLFTLDGSRLCASRLQTFVAVNHKFVQKAGPSSKRDYPRDLDVLVQALGSMNKTTRSRQASLLPWVVRSGSSEFCY